MPWVYGPVNGHNSNNLTLNGPFTGSGTLKFESDISARVLYIGATSPGFTGRVVFSGDIAPYAQVQGGANGDGEPEVSLTSTGASAPARSSGTS